MSRLEHLALLILGMLLALGSFCYAQTGSSELPMYDPHFYESLVSADSNATIPPGTVINAQNWRQYKQFMPMGMQLLLSGRLPTFAPPADFQMVVGPTKSYPLPRKFIADSEKYSPQVRLVHLADGGTSLEGYVSGLPFPHPSGPDEATELLWDNYYNWQPHLGHIDTWSQATDRYVNRNATRVTCVHFKLLHISDPDLPPNLPEAKGIFLTENCEVWEPEESKYTTSLQLFYDDPARVAENYVFVPALRRSLRLSSAARCAPFAGGDFTNDDFRNGMNLQVPIFQSKFLGVKKILTMVFDDHTFYLPYSEGANPPPQFYYPSYIPRTNVGKWQLRDMYVFDNRRIPSQSKGYCYGNRVIFLDKEQFAPQWLDLYDAELKYWKFYWNLYYPELFPQTGEHTFGSGTTSGFFLMQEFQNTHEDAAWQAGHWGTNCPAEFRDFSRWGTPAGLLQVMQ
jgi:hypothetical protein